MKKRVITALLVFASVAQAQEQGRGLLLHDEAAFDGYTLFAPLGKLETHLIDMAGSVVHSWKSMHEPANSAFLLPSGDLLRSAKSKDNPRFGNRGPSGGRVELFDWEGKQLWDFVYSSDQHHQHHDITPLPNGNVLLIAWEYKSVDEAVAVGRKPELISEDGFWPDKIVEVKQTGPTVGEVVWEWHMWDHLIQDADPTKANYGDVAAHPELVDVNLNARTRSDWMHTNGVAYNAELDQIILCIHSFGEFFVIDHSTTTQEADGHAGGRAGRGGDILYRWGNPANYRAGQDSDRKLFGQHDARWIRSGRPGSGHILVFNNGRARPDGDYSSVDEIVPPVNSDGSYRIAPGTAFEPSDPVWSYVAASKMDFFSSFISGADRMPNGNTLICAGALGDFFEVTSEGKKVWRYLNPFVQGTPDAGPRPRPGAGRRANREGGGQRGPGRGEGGARGRGRRPRAGNASPRGGSPQSPHIVFRVIRYAPDYAGLSGRNLEPVAK